MRLYQNPFVFFLIEESDILVWDYYHHQQFKIDVSYFERLLFWSPFKDKSTLDRIDTDLLEGGLLQEEPLKMPNWQWDVLSKIFHMGTQNIPVYDSPPSKKEWIREYAEECEDLPREITFSRKGPVVELPSADTALLKEKDYLTVLLSRKTNRVFRDTPMSLETLSTLLRATFGNIHEDARESSGGFYTAGVRKTSPSGGGLHPLEAYVVIFNVQGLEKGLYHYSFQGHTLTRIGDEVTYQDMIPLFYNQFYLENIAMGVFLVAHFDRCWDKYRHSRAYRIALMDTGHLSQTFLLNATSLGLNTWLSAAFQDKEIARLLGIDGMTQAPLHFVAAGEGENLSIPSV